MNCMTLHRRYDAHKYILELGYCREPEASEARDTGATELMVYALCLVMIILINALYNKLRLLVILLYSSLPAIVQF